MPASPDLAAVPFVGADLAESTGLEQAAGFVVDLLDRPGSDIRVAEGQLGLLEDVVVPGHPDGFQAFVGRTVEDCVFDLCEDR